MSCVRRLKVSQPEPVYPSMVDYNTSSLFPLENPLRKESKRKFSNGPTKPHPDFDFLPENNPLPLSSVTAVQ